MTVSSGCCSPDASAASAHTGHHTCWHLPGPSPPAAARAAASPHRGIEPVQDGLRQLPQFGTDVGVRRRSRRPHLRIRSKPHGQLTASQLRIHHDASPQDGRQPNPAPHTAGADDQVIVDPAQRQTRRSRPAATLAASGRRLRDRIRIRGRLSAAAVPAVATRRACARASSSSPSALAPIGSPARCGTSTSCTSPIVVSSSSSTARCSEIRSAYQSKAGCSGRLRYSIRIVLHQNLIDDQLVDLHPHQRQRAQRADRLGGDHPLGGHHQMRADPRSVGEQRRSAARCPRRCVRAARRPPPSAHRRCRTAGDAAARPARGTARTSRAA